MEPGRVHPVERAGREHELAIEAEPAAFPHTEGWPDPTVPVGVAASSLDVQLIPR